jgi:hypothetical protein
MSKSQSTVSMLTALASRLWWIIAKALGEKAHHHNRVADQVALVRLLILGSYMITNTLICAGVLRHWND